MRRFLTREWWTSFLAAVLVHSFLFFGTGFAFVSAPRYGMEASAGGIEVYLTAALPASGPQAEVMQEATDLEAGSGTVAQLVEKQAETVPSKAEGKTESAARNNSKNVGDGSSAVPGKDPTTYYSQGGGSTDEKKGFLKNPPPVYPDEAIERNQEGLVLIKALINKAGLPTAIEVQQSSGYRLLDQAALRAVRRWKFDPAKMGLLRMDASIEIPIRFVLEEGLKTRR